MFLVLALLLATPSVAPANDRLSRLARERGAFEEIAPGIGSRFNGPISNVYYPLGSFTERFTLTSFPAGGEIVFHKLIGKRVRTAWTLGLARVDETKIPKPRRGTLRRLIWGHGLRLVSRRLTQAQRTRLDAEVGLAGYGDMPFMENLYSYFVRKDGSSGVPDRYDPSPLYLKLGFLPITAEESAALGFADQRWAGKGDFTITRTGT